MIFAATLDQVLAREAQAATPFNLLTLAIFLGAIVHTLLAHHFTALAKRVGRKKGDTATIMGELLYFLGEIEVVFALWVIPLVIAVTAFFGFDEMIQYLNSRVYIEPFFIVVVMSLASSRPLFKLAEKGVHSVGKFFGDSPESWWLTILTLGPILGSVITEAAAMTVSALLLRKKLYSRKPSNRLAYGTMGLMFVNFSVGGVFTNFATPPSLTLSRCWNWDLLDFFSQFGWRVFVGMVIVNLLYFTLFRKDFAELGPITHQEEERRESDQHKGPVPVWITCVHLAFLGWTILTAHYLPIFFGSYLLYLGFNQATKMHQYRINLKRPLMVGLFLAGLVIHGGFQGWWIEPLIGDLGYGAMMVTGTILTAFNENTTVAFLACLLDNLQPNIQYALVSGLAAGGGLTIMAHAPNPAGQALLRPYFRTGISSWKVFLAALGPTLIFLLIFYVFPSSPVA